MASHDIALMGAIFPDVPKILLPISGGGMATFTDVSDTTAAAADVMSGKYFYTSDGARTAGTAQAGLMYESGSFSPTSNISSYTVNFSNSHTKAPFFFAVSDTKDAYYTNTGANYWIMYFNWYDAFGTRIYTAESTPIYGAVYTRYRNSSGFTGSSIMIENQTGNTTYNYKEYWCTNTNLYLSTGSTSRYWRSGRKFNWIAVFAA